MKEKRPMKATVNHRETIRRGRVFDFTLENVTLTNGANLDMEIIRHPGAAAIMPLTDDRHVIMLRQYRHATGQSIWEIPAGTFEKKGHSLACARRELAEETGYSAQQWDDLGSIIPVPGYSDEKIDLYLARRLSPAAQNLDPDEEIEVHALPLDQVVSMIECGDIIDAKTIASVFRTIQKLGQLSY